MKVDDSAQTFPRFGGRCHFTMMKYYEEVVVNSLEWQYTNQHITNFGRMCGMIKSFTLAVFFHRRSASNGRYPSMNFPILNGFTLTYSCSEKMVIFAG